MKTKFSGRRPVMFLQICGERGYGAVDGSRVRIFYPDGTTEWCALTGDAMEYAFDEPPCWLQIDEFDVDKGYYKPNNIKESIRLANRYDRQSNWPKMEFLGEL
jgi:hypothetical protein